jgi:hypothetical protein
LNRNSRHATRSVAKLALRASPSQLKSFGHLLRLPTVGDNAAMQTEPPKTKTRRFQVSLRTLFVVVTVAALVSALVSAIASRLPNELTYQQLHSVKACMTEDQTLDLLGRPDAIEPNENGGVDWKYGGFWPDTIEFKDCGVVSAFRF